MTKSLPHLVLRLALLLTIVLFGAACGEDDPSCPGAPSPGSDPDPDLAYPPVGTMPATLAEWDLFKDGPNQVPKDDVIPFEVSSPLFTDFALKHRFIYVPPGDGCEIGYSATEKWVFPKGSVLVKTFAFPVDERDPGLGEQLIETRLLINEGKGGWRALVYQWDEMGQTTMLQRIGATVDVTYTLENGDERNIPFYTIPQENDCKDCHNVSDVMKPIGPSTAMLNIDNTYDSAPENQVDYIQALGLFDRAPEAVGDRFTLPDPFEVGGLNSPNEKARSYMHSNCGHCHSRTGPVFDKTLYLDYASTDPEGDTPPANWGVCKPPTSAGNSIECEGFTVDVEPGDPDESLLSCRVETVDVGKMPPIGRTQLHDEGLALIEDWILDLALPACN